MINSLFKRYYFFIFILLSAILFLTGYDYAYPIEANPDEVGQLKNVYAMIKSKSLALQYYSSYSVWTHYIYILPILTYWGVFFLFSDLSSVTELQNYIMNNYFQVVPFLRIFTALFFLFSLILIREILKNILNVVQANLFFIFISINLLIVINTHYAKHWMVDTALIFCSFYLYYKFNQNRQKKIYRYFTYFLFSFGVLSSYPLILSGVYLVLIYFYFNKSIKEFFYDVLIFIVIFALMIAYTFFMGAGGIVNSNNLQPSFSFDITMQLVGYSLDYAPFLTLFFVSSLLLLVYQRNYKFLIALIPYLGYLILLSFYRAEPRYTLFLIIDSAFLSTFILKYMYDNYKVLFKTIFTVYVAFNLFVVSSWLNIITKEDTRELTRNWILNEITNQDFIIYNTFGFNYVPLTKQSINDIIQTCPNSVSSREKLHLKYNLTDGTNGAILWKIQQDKECSLSKIINSLKNKDYNIYFINERFGKVALFDQPNKKSYKELFDNFDLTVEKEISPYKNNPEYKEKIGDIILNFEHIFYTLNHLERSGPVITIYKVNKNEL